MSQPWLIASLLLAVATVLCWALRQYRATSARAQQERQQARQTEELHLATVEALALAIDAKDQTTPDHIRRIQAYSTGVAQELGLATDEVQAVRMAALLHDIGKLAVPEHILSKPGPLTPEEFQKICIHPQAGADILAGVPFPYPVTPIILSHHERWDGRGYPRGIKEDDIPIGARILAVVDCYDALTSDRPYHRSINSSAAFAILQQDAGKAFDPRVVEAFGRVVAAHGTTAEPELAQAGRAAVALPQERVDLVTNLGHHAAEAGKASVFDNIALAHREIYALYQIAQTMGTSLGVVDTMGLIASKLSILVPFSACALFLRTDEDDALSCRFATGTDSELIQQLTLRGGLGLTGWVARNRRSLVNARPSADIEAMNSDAPTVLNSALVCPLIFGDRLIGTLAVYHTDASFYRDDHRRLLERVCEQAAAVIHNAIVFEQTQEDSLTDPLTGLPNTRFMFMHLSRELARAQRMRTEVSLLVIDLDDFKTINDNHGHHTGDRALREVAAVLREVIRPYDVCVRYAGDEFIVVLSGCGHDEAESKRVELKDAVAAIVFEVAAGQRVPVSISAGAAVFPHDGDSYESLLATADGRMYGDKSRRKHNPSRQVPGGAPSFSAEETRPISSTL